MESRQWWTALAVIALVACAAARPGDSIDNIKTNEISGKDTTTPKNSESTTVAKFIDSVLSGNGEESVKPVVVNATATTTIPTNSESTTKAKVIDSENTLSGNSEESVKPEVVNAAATTTQKNSESTTEAKVIDGENTLSANREESVKPEVVNDAATDAKPKPVKERLTVAKAVHEQYPHAVLFGGTCGGSIISPKWVLSAGHCTLFSGGRYVLAGTNNSEDGSGIIRHVKRLIIHPKFSVGPYWLDADRFHIKQVAANWDFLLAELEEPLPLDGKTIAAVELDSGPSIPEGLEVGYAGYGAAHHGDVMRDKMHGMELQVLADRKCQEALVQYDPKDMVCTQGRPPRYDSACNGDSGSGLVANGKLYGVASWVENDAHRCYNGAKVVFSRVSAARDWIKQVTKI